MSTRRILCRAGVAAALSAAALVAAPVTSAFADYQGHAGTLEDPWYPNSRPAVVTCDSAHMFGNYRDGSHNLQDPFFLTHKGDRLHARYHTHDNYAVDVENPDSSTHWGFIQRDCIDYTA